MRLISGRENANRIESSSILDIFLHLQRNNYRNSACATVRNAKEL
jgi:hypothetical protein